MEKENSRNKKKVYPETVDVRYYPGKRLYISHAKNISFHHINFYYEKPDGRPLFVTKDVENIRFTDIRENGEDVSITINQ